MGGKAMIVEDQHDQVSSGLMNPICTLARYSLDNMDFKRRNCEELPKSTKGNPLGSMYNFITEK
jgi:hypothetical protein